MNIPTPDHECIIFCPHIEVMAGAERSVFALSRWLHDNAIRHSLVVYYDALGVRDFVNHPVTVMQLAPGQRRKKIGLLRKYLAARPADAPKPLVSGYQAALHATLAGARGFHTLMHDTPSLFSGGNATDTLRKWLRRRIGDGIVGYGLRSGGKTIVTSEYLKSEAEQVFGGETVIARMGGMDLDAVFRPRIVEGRLNMLSVSRVEGNKRIDWMIRALAALETDAAPLSRQVDWRLDVVGEGALVEKLKALARDLKLADRVRFLGFVDDATLARYYDQAHLFLMPARQGYGIPAIEALCRGIPVLLHRDSGVSDILRDTPWCVVMEGGEEAMPAALLKSVRTLLDRRHVDARLPPIPTEAQWAEKVARFCGWIS